MEVKMTLTRYKNENNKIGLRNDEGKIVVPAQYDSIEVFSDVETGENSWYPVKIVNNEKIYGKLNYKTGKTIAPCLFSSIDEADDYGEIYYPDIARNLKDYAILATPGAFEDFAKRHEMNPNGAYYAIMKGLIERCRNDIRAQKASKSKEKELGE